MKIEIWSDIRCPFCYIGKKKFEAGLEKFPHRDQVSVEWHSFELDPGLKTDKQVDVYSYFARRKNISVESSRKMHGQVTEMAREAGLDYHFEKTVIANSFDAHRLIQLAKKFDLGDAAEERLFKAYFTEGMDISDHLTLIVLGNEIGLDGKLVKQMLDGDTYAGEVRYDQKQAVDIGIHGVPFFLINDRYAVSGAQPAEVFLETLNKGWEEYELENHQAVIFDEAPDNCVPGGHC